jgi:predicted RNase H-like nuclease (RuvC/YqgF family)
MKWAQEATESGGYLSEKKHIIVGIDPGATFGIAMVGLDGRKIATRSTMGGFSDATRMIETFGTPSLVACDTNPAPEAALRLASYFSCKLFVPRASVREEDKRQVAHGAGTSNTHERDAYCAAVFAYRAHANKLRQLDALADLTHDERDRIKHLLLRGVRVQDAFMMLREPEREEPRAHAKAQPAMKTASSEELRSRLESLARENANLRISIERLEEEKAALMQRLRLMENGVRQTVLRDSEFRKLRFQLQQAMNRLTWRKKKGTAHFQPPAKKEEFPAKEAKKPGRSEQINNLSEPEIDLERLVAEYRKGRR